MPVVVIVISSHCFVMCFRVYGTPLAIGTVSKRYEVHHRPFLWPSSDDGTHYPVRSVIADRPSVCSTRCVTSGCDETGTAPGGHGQYLDGKDARARMPETDAVAGEIGCRHPRIDDRGEQVGKPSDSIIHIAMCCPLLHIR